MDTERTLVFIKPNAVQDNNIGNILVRFEEEDLRVAAIKMVMLSKEKAEGFYIEHKDRSYFGPLISFMISGPTILVVLEGRDAVTKSRELIGADNPEDAAPHTLRRLYARSVVANAVHGSSSTSSSEREISYFFTKEEIHPRH